MARKTKAHRSDFVHHDEGPEILGELLAAAGCPLDVGEVIDRMRSWACLTRAGLSDDVYLAARRLVFELYAMIELGRPSGRQEAGGARSIPPRLGRTRRVREVVDASLAALWEALAG